MKTSVIKIIIAIGTISLLGAVLGTIIWQSRRQANSGMDPEIIKGYAQELQNNQLYRLATQEYAKLAASPTLPAAKRANVNFIIGKIYLENLADYENALASFLKAKQDDKAGKLTMEIDRLIVEALEKMGRHKDAQFKMAASTALETPAATQEGVVVAKIGAREIHEEELNKAIQALPEHLQASLKTPAKKLDFLKQYVTNELLNDAAIRLGLDKDPQLNETVENYRQQLLTEKIYAREVRSKVSVTPDQVKDYFATHAKDYQPASDSDKEEVEFAEVSAKVENDLRRQREQEIFTNYLSELNQAQKVVIYDDQIR